MFSAYFSAVCLIFLVLYKCSHAFKYYFKYFWYIFGNMFWSFTFIPIFCLRPWNVKNLLFSTSIIRAFISPVLGIKWVLRDTQYMAEDKSFIIVANHQSMLDILGQFMMWPIMRKCTVITKNEVFYVWPFGLSAWLAGLIFIPRNQAEKAKAIMAEAGEMIKKKKIKLWIFPEGKRYSDGQIHDFKKGAFHIAIKAQLPILPVVFSQYNFLDHKKKHFDSGTVIATVLPPISTEGKTFDDLDDLLEEARQKMIAKFNEVNQEIKSFEKL